MVERAGLSEEDVLRIDECVIKKQTETREYTGFGKGKKVHEGALIRAHTAGRKKRQWALD